MVGAGHLQHFQVTPPPAEGQITAAHHQDIGILSCQIDTLWVKDAVREGHRDQAILVPDTAGPPLHQRLAVSIRVDDHPNLAAPRPAQPVQNHRFKKGQAKGVGGEQSGLPLGHFQNCGGGCRRHRPDPELAEAGHRAASP